MSNYTKNDDKMQDEFLIFVKDNSKKVRKMMNFINDDEEKNFRKKF